MALTRGQMASQQHPDMLPSITGRSSSEQHLPPSRTMMTSPRRASASVPSSTPAACLRRRTTVEPAAKQTTPAAGAGRASRLNSTAAGSAKAACILMRPWECRIEVLPENCMNCMSHVHQALGKGLGHGAGYWDDGGVANGSSGTEQAVPGYKKLRGRTLTLLEGGVAVR